MVQSAGGIVTHKSSVEIVGQIGALVLDGAENIVHHCATWCTMVNHGVSWYTIVYHGTPLCTMVHHGVLW